MEGNGKQTLETLLSYPAPRPDEWLGSWIARLAHSNYLRPSRLLELLDIQPGTAELSKESRQQLLDLTHVTPTALAALATPEDPLRRPRKEGTGIRDLFGVEKIQICPHCLAEDKIPYIRRDWVRRSITSCPEHGGPLRENCPHCGKYLHVAAIKEPARESYNFKAEKITTCWSCKKSIIDPLNPVEPSQKSLPVPSLGGRRFNPASFDSFRTALWIYLYDFKLYLAMDQNTVPFGLMPKESLRSASEDSASRSKAEQIVEWLLTPTTSAEPYSEHHRLRILAHAILGLFLNINETSNQRWLYATWLATRLRDDAPVLLLRDWPPLVQFLAGKVNEETPSIVPSTFQLTDEQWTVVETLLPLHHSRAVCDPREAFNFLLNRALNGINYKAAEVQEEQDGWSKAIDYWKTSPRLGMALEALEQHFRSTFIKPVSPANYMRTHGHHHSNNWRKDTARLFTSDGMLELLRQCHPALHRQLLTDNIRLKPRQS